MNDKVFVEPGYYEIKLRPLTANDKPSRFNGVEGLFTGRTNVFNTFESALSYILRKNFSDSIVIDKCYESELISLGYEDYRWSDDEEFILFQ